MAISIRLPTDPSLPSYHYKPASRPLLNSRLTRRLLPLTLLLLLALETYRIFRTNPTDTATTSDAHTDISFSIPPTPPQPHLTHLIFTAAHSIWTRDAGWPAIQPFQKGQESTWLQHVERSAELARADPTALLVFSGGETHRETGPRSEAASYFELAQYKGFLNATGDELWARATTETYALDSYQNLAFSVCRFREMTGGYPEKVTAVGYGFKEKRFAEVHRRALGLGAEAWSYVGIDPVWGDGEEVAAMLGEQRVREEWARCELGVLEEKRRGRNWGARNWGGYLESCPEMAEVWSGCGEADGGPWR